MTKYDDKGHPITTHEGHSGYIAPEIKEYFRHQYLSQGIRVVPGHWPSMETKEDVDQWISSLNLMNSLFDDSDDDNDDDL